MANSFPPVVVRIDGKEWMLPVEVNFRMVLVSERLYAVEQLAGGNPRQRL